MRVVERGVVIERGRCVVRMGELLRIDGRVGRGKREGRRRGRSRIGGMVGGGVS